MSRQDEPALARLSDEILSYLRAHPQAADTVDGIVEWWLPRQRHDEAVDRVQHALDELVARGLVDKIVLTPVDGKVEIDVQGDLAGILMISAQKKNPAWGRGGSQVKMVAGAGFEPAAFRL